MMMLNWKVLKCDRSIRLNILMKVRSTAITQSHKLQLMKIAARKAKKKGKEIPPKVQRQMEKWDAEDAAAAADQKKSETDTRQQWSL